jgi:uroporphyrinogen decarboxylase
MSRPAPMRPRDRVLTALDHRPPDRIPRDYWATAEVTAALQAHLGLPDRERLLQHLGVDLRYVAGPSYVGQRLRSYDDGSVEDLWGVRRRTKRVEVGAASWTYQHVVQSPLQPAQSVADVEAYGRWPSADGWDYSQLRAQCLAHRGYAVVNAGDRLDRTAQLKPMMYLRGMEQAYLDLALNPAVAEATIAHIVGYFLSYNERVFTAAGRAIDIFMMGDDFGTQQGPMMSLEAWRRFFRPGFAAFIELAHRHGLKVMHHTCGSVTELIPDFIACGLDILQSLQPQAAGMDLGRLRHEFGRDLCFQGGMDIQGVLPHGTPDQVREHVRQQIEAAGHEGGYILCTAHNLQPDTPLENVLALFEAYEQYS